MTFALKPSKRSRSQNYHISADDSADSFLCNQSAAARSAYCSRLLCKRLYNSLPPQLLVFMLSDLINVISVVIDACSALGPGVYLLFCTLTFPCIEGQEGGLSVPLGFPCIHICKQRGRQHTVKLFKKMLLCYL